MASDEWRDTAVVAGLALVPGVGGALSVVAGKALEQRREGARVAGEAALAVGDDPDRFVEAVSNDPRLSMLLANAAEAATRTAVDDKRRMLGLVVGRAALDSARIDESELLVAVIADLEVVHISCLEGLLRLRQRAVERGDDLEAVTDAVHEAAKGYPTPVVAKLIRHGCLHPATVLNGGTSVYDVTEFGTFLLEDLRAQARSIEPVGDR